MEFHGDGIYFGMPADEYHKHPYCGSSNCKTLYSSPPDFWFESAMNPLREDEEESFAQKFGSAIHDRILYGEEYFKKHYRFVAGEKGETVSAEGLKDWIVGQGGFPKKLKADNERMVVKEMGTQLLTERIYQKIMVSAQMILKNPNLMQAFTGGWPEVSIFWKREGVPLKCRLDYFKKLSTVDLKSFRSKERVMTLDEMVLKDLFNYRYDVQVALYQYGRTAAKKLLEEGKVYVAPGAMAPEGDWLEAALAKPAPWVFVFYKADGMPISKSYQVPIGSACEESGRVAVEVAIRNYITNMEMFGTDAWVNIDPPYPIDAEDLPKWL